MLHFAITVWFTFSTLFGPLLCCCSFDTQTQPVSQKESQPLPKPKTSCCQPPVETTNPDESQQPSPQKPSKCPCKSDSCDLSTEPTTNRDTLSPTSPLKPVDAPTLTWHLSVLSELLGSQPNISHSLISPHTLSGRSLLANFSILRC